MNMQFEEEARTNAGGILTNLYDVGAAWARYGLAVAEASLEASSRTLQSTARALGNIAEAIQRTEGDDSIVTSGEAAENDSAKR